MIKSINTALITLSLFISVAHASSSFDCQKAPLLVKKTVTICGQLVEVVPQSQFHRIMLNLNKPFPHEAMAFEVTKEHLQAFQTEFPDLQSLIGHRICAHGRIIKKNGHLRMKISTLVSEKK